MENKLFMYEGTVPLPPLQAEPSPSSSTTVLLPAWQSLSSAVGAQPTGLHCASGQSPHCLYNNLGCEKSTTDYVFAKFDSASALSSIVSSPAGSTSKISCDSFVIGELIGKPGTMSNSDVQISANSHPLFRAMTATAASHITSNLSYNELLNSPPPKLSTPMVDHLHKLEYNMPVNSVVSEFSGDPGFAERAARFSRFGSRSFHGRTAQFALNSGGAVNGSMQIPANAKLARVSSTPSINAQESHIGVQHSTNSPVQNKAELSVSQEGSSISEQIPSVETGPKAANAFVSSRKRKANSRGKVKENGTSPSAADSTKGVDEANESSSAKKCKQDVRNGNENEPKESIETASEDKQTKTEANPVEPPKDYIHVRARRGQATDSHSLAERVRREKISERMKILQDLVPGCNKVIGKALMLDEIINYVQSLQRQVEFLSMKLATLDYKADPHSSKDMFQSNSTIQKLMLQPLDSSASVLYGHQYQKNPTVHGNIMEGTTTQYSVDPLGDAHLHTFDGLSDHTLTPFCGDDLQTIVQLGFGQNMLAAEAAFDAQDLRRENLVANMKVEL